MPSEDSCRSRRRSPAGCNHLSSWFKTYNTTRVACANDRLTMERAICEVLMRRWYLIVTACLLASIASPSALAVPVGVQQGIPVAQSVELESILYSPPNAVGPTPVIVMVSGSGMADTTSDAYTKQHVKSWLDAGIAVFAYNKR